MLRGEIMSSLRDMLPDECFVEVDATTIPPEALLPLSMLSKSSKYHSKKYSKEARYLYSPLVRIPNEFAKHFKIPIVEDPARYIEEWDKIEIHASFGPWVGSSL